MSHVLSMTPVAGVPELLGPLRFPEVGEQLQAAARAGATAEAEILLREALELDPYCIDTYIGFCRLFVRQRRALDAENAALAAVSVSARAAGLEPDWRVQQGHLDRWNEPGQAERRYLAALDALAAVRSMQGRTEEYAAIMHKLQELGGAPRRARAA